MSANTAAVIKIADGIETNSPQIARKLRQILVRCAPPREVAAEIFRQRRAARLANNQARG
jgi:hypothetical protein